MAADGCISLFRDSSGMIQLWMVGTGLFLTRDDLLALIAMISEVARQSSTRHGERADTIRIRRAEQYRELRVTPDGVCFEN
jgi:hypothetical protein